MHGTESIDSILDDSSTILDALHAGNSLSTSWMDVPQSAHTQLQKEVYLLTSGNFVYDSGSGILRHVVHDYFSTETSVHQSISSS